MSIPPVNYSVPPPRLDMPPPGAPPAAPPLGSLSVPPPQLFNHPSPYSGPPLPPMDQPPPLPIPSLHPLNIPPPSVTAYPPPVVPPHFPPPPMAQPDHIFLSPDFSNPPPPKPKEKYLDTPTSKDTSDPIRDHREKLSPLNHRDRSEERDRTYKAESHRRHHSSPPHGSSYSRSRYSHSPSRHSHRERDDYRESDRYRDRALRERESEKERYYKDKYERERLRYEYEKRHSPSHHRSYSSDSRLDNYRRSPSRYSLRSPGRSARSPSRSSYRSPSRSSYWSPSKHSYRSPSRQSYRSPSRHSYRSPSRHSYRSPSRHRLLSPSRHRLRSPSRYSHRSPSRHGYRSPSRHSHRSPSKHSHRSPSREHYRSHHRELSPRSRHDSLPKKPLTDREKILEEYRKNYCQTSEDLIEKIQKWSKENKQEEEETPKMWYRSSPAELYYMPSENGGVKQTPKLTKICDMFFTKVVERGRKARPEVDELPPLKAPKAKMCKHKLDEKSSSSSSSESEESLDEDGLQGYTDRIMVELQRKQSHPRRLHPEMWFNNTGEMNGGPLCRCSARARRHGMRHGVYAGEQAFPKCLPDHNNLDKLYHYRITVSPPTNFLIKAPTIIGHDEHEFLFSGFSMFSHYKLARLPTCKVIRFNIEYTILYVEEPAPVNFTVRELDLFGEFLYTIAKLWKGFEASRSQERNLRATGLPRYLAELTKRCNSIVFCFL